MSRTHEVYEESTEMAGTRYVARILKLDNAVIMFLDEDMNFRLGTIALAVPDLGGTHHLSSPLLGGRNVNIARILAERICMSFKRMVLVSIHLSTELNSELYGQIAKLTDALIEKTVQDK